MKAKKEINFLQPLAQGLVPRNACVIPASNNV